MILSKSLIIPIHNEEAYLPYSLRGLRRAIHGFDEIIFILDDCSDRSYDWIDKFVPEAMMLLVHNHQWRFFAGENMQRGFNVASGDILMVSAGDIVLDREIPEILDQEFSNPQIGMVSLWFKNFDLFSIKHRIHGIYAQSLSLKSYKHDSGIFAIRRSVLDHVGGLKDITTEYLDLYIRARQGGWKISHVKTKILHLRVGMATKRKQYIQGVAKHNIILYNHTLIILQSLIHVKPYQLLGFYHAKKYGITEEGTLGL